MIYASFGIKIFFDRDLLLTENFELVHYGKGTRGESTIDSPSDIYFYIRDEQICKERDDANYVINVINLTKIPIYQGNNPEFRLWKDDYVRKELIDNSTVCLYYFYDDNKIKPSIAECTRALLRRVPKMILVSDTSDPDLQLILSLARSQGVQVNVANSVYPYKAVAILV